MAEPWWQNEEVPSDDASAEDRGEVPWWDQDGPPDSDPDDSDPQSSRSVEDESDDSEPPP